MIPYTTFDNISVSSSSKLKISRSKVICTSRFHPVGQGLFYSSQIKFGSAYNNEKFTVVYDCGSYSGDQYLDTAIDELNFDGFIDLLIVSHFHNDHINGIKELIKAADGVERVVLPYLSPEEILLVAFELSLITGSSAYSVRFISMMTEPATFFKNKKLKIYLIFPNSNQVNEDNEKRSDNERDGWERFGDQSFQKNLGAEALPNAIYIPHTAVLPKHMWRFKFYYRKDLGKKEQLIRRILKCKKITSAMNGIAELFDSKYKEIKNNYDKLFPAKPGSKKRYIDKHNRMSLCCCHGPMQEYSNRSLMQMLTGDSDMKIKALNKFKKHYKHEIDSIFIYQIPHHGSKKNWCKDIIDDQKPFKWWVIPCGLGNQYKHPSRTVVDDLVNAGIKPIVVDQLDGFTWRLTIKSQHQ